ncbi:hypothetical protein [Sphingomonas aerophila]|uniref:Uncharacterized protein n=1 Tax=Sphingomonas aerophila TaxID=1344948 RepID=A0A7W9ETI7_9SPHN|nr:hypothetical protein [Sphingomonas aerophila]MBB5714200.1 hypothetical protein [Sphingomonas aerophila]
MTFIAIATLMMTLISDGTASAVPPAPVPRVGNEAPALAGVMPPAGTTLANMDITVKPRARGETAVYELRSQQSAAVFRDQYVLNARRAGYQVVAKGLLVVGARKDGTSIRLRVIEADRGSVAVLTVKPPTNDRT